MYLFIYLSIDLSVYLSIYLSIHLSIYRQKLPWRVQAGTAAAAYDKANVNTDLPGSRRPTKFGERRGGGTHAGNIAAVKSFLGTVHPPPSRLAEGFRSGARDTDRHRVRVGRT